MINDYRNPVGSVQVQQDYGRTSDVNGRIMNQGVFSPNNPYLENMRLATGEDDKNRWYQAAVQWEADNYNTQESREYNSPANQIALQRAAGINPDISGTSGSSGSSGSSSGATIPQQQINTDFTTEAEKMSLVFEGINTAMNSVNTFVSAYSSIANSVMQFRRLPSEIALNTSNSNLANAQAYEIDALLDGKKTSQTLTNQGQALANTSSILSAIDSLIPIIQPNSTDEQMSSLLQGVGLGAEHLPLLKQAHSNPEYLAKRKQAQFEERRLNARLAAATDDILLELEEDAFTLQRISNKCAIAEGNIRKHITSALVNSTYKNDVADALIQDASNTKMSGELAMDYLRRDFSAYEQSLQQIMDVITKLESRNADLDKIAENRPLDPVEQLEYDKNRMRISRAYSLGSREVNSIYTILDDSMQQQFYLESNVHYSKDKGLIQGIVGTGIPDDTIVYGNIAFKDLVRGVYTTTELTNMFMSSAGQLIQGIGVGLGAGVGAAKGIKQMSYKPNRVGF